jgi:DNA polymerase III subunit epsilon
MIIGGLDFETSGRNTETHTVVEAGIVLWCTELRRPIRSSAFLVYDPDTVWEDGASEVNGITQEQTKVFGVDTETALKRVIQFYRQADVICTYNGTIFDKLFYENWCQRFGYLEFKNQNKTWIDAKIDLPFPNKKWHSLSLKHLACEHGILHYHAHGALPDANITLEIMDRYSLDTVMESAKSPTVTIQALVSYADREKAKTLGFYWRPEPLKQWVKAVKACRVPEEEEAAVLAGFHVKIIKN